MRYNPETGDLFWNEHAPARSRNRKAGAESMGYLRIHYKKRYYKVHRIAWMLVHGSLPEGDLDHINGDKMDNRISNLRVVSVAVNQQNLKKAKISNKLGLLGVSAKGSRFRAQITVDQKKKYIGTFATAIEAHTAYIAAKRELHIGGTI
jgi:hypothetical protein